METTLNAELIYSDVHLFELRVSAWNGLFGGTTNVYVGIGALTEAAEIIAGFPHRVGDERVVEFGGGFGPNSAGGAVRIRLYTEGAAGHPFVEIQIESEYEKPRSAQNAFLRSVIDANAVDAFVRELRSLEDKKAGVAQLELRG